MKALRCLLIAAAFSLSGVLSGCSMLEGMLGQSSNIEAGFDISNPKNLALMCARSDETVDWQACFSQVNQVCGDQNHAENLALHGPLHTNQPFYNGYYITFQCEEGYSDGEEIHLNDPVSGADVVLQPPPAPEPLPDLGFGDSDGGSTPPAAPPAGSTPPAATPPAGSTPPAATPPAGTPPAGTPPATSPTPQPPASSTPPASGKPPAGSKPPASGKPPASSQPPASSTPPASSAPKAPATPKKSAGTPAPVTVITTP